MDESSEGSSMNMAMRRCGSSVDEITEKLQTIYVDDGNDHSNLVEHDDSNLSKNDCCDGLNNQLPIDFNDVNHLFHMNFMQSMQLLRSQEKRFVNYVKSYSLNTGCLMFMIFIIFMYFSFVINLL